MIFNSKYAYEIKNIDSIFIIKNDRITSENMDIDDNPGFIADHINDIEIIGYVAHDSNYTDGYCIFTKYDKAFMNNEGILYNVNEFNYSSIEYGDVAEYLSRDNVTCDILNSEINIDWDLIEYLDLESNALDWFIDEFSNDPGAAGYDIYDYDDIGNWLARYQINNDYMITSDGLKPINVKISWDIYNMIHDSLIVDHEPDYLTVEKINNLLIEKVLLKM